MGSSGGGGQTLGKKFIELGKIGTKLVDETGIANKKIPVYDQSQGKYLLEYSTGVTQADYVVSNVAELDAALADIKVSGIGGSIAMKKGTYDKGSPIIFPNVNNIRLFSELGAIIIPPASDNTIVIGEDSSAYIFYTTIENITFDGRNTTKAYIKTANSGVSGGWRQLGLRIKNCTLGGNNYTTETCLNINVFDCLIEGNIIDTGAYLGPGANHGILSGFFSQVRERNNVYNQGALSLLSGGHYDAHLSQGNQFRSYKSVPMYLLRAAVPTAARYCTYHNNLYGYVFSFSSPYMIDALAGVTRYIDQCHISGNSIHQQNGVGTMDISNIVNDPANKRFVYANYRLK